MVKKTKKKLVKKTAKKASKKRAIKSPKKTAKRTKKASKPKPIKFWRYFSGNPLRPTFAQTGLAMDKASNFVVCQECAWQYVGHSLEREPCYYERNRSCRLCARAMECTK